MCCDTLVGKDINVVQVGAKRLFGVFELGLKPRSCKIVVFKLLAQTDVILLITYSLKRQHLSFLTSMLMSVKKV